VNVFKRLSRVRLCGCLSAVMMLAFPTGGAGQKVTPTKPPPQAAPPGPATSQRAAATPSGIAILKFEPRPTASRHLAPPQPSAKNIALPAADYAAAALAAFGTLPSSIVIKKRTLDGVHGYGDVNEMGVWAQGVKDGWFFGSGSMRFDGSSNSMLGFFLAVHPNQTYLFDVVVQAEQANCNFIVNANDAQYVPCSTTAQPQHLLFAVYGTAEYWLDFSIMNTASPWTFYTATVSTVQRLKAN